MSDRELIERAAKAAGIEGEWVRDTAYMQERYYFNVPYDHHNMLTGFRWNPLLEDGDALRLAVKKSMSVRINTLLGVVEVSCGDGPVGNQVRERLGGDPCAATRRAIVRAAAALAGDGEQS